MLSAAERRKVQICVAYKTEQPRPTWDRLAARFGVSQRTVATAIRWGETRGIFTDDLAERLRIQLTEWREHLAFLESELRLRKRLARTKDTHRRIPVNSTALAVLSREIREVRTRIDELDGIYKQTVNVQLTGKDGAPLPTAITIKLVKADGSTDS